MPRETREIIYAYGKKKASAAAGVVRRWVFTRKREKLAFYSDTPPANTPYRIFVDLESFGGALFREYKKSPLYNWYSRSASWGNNAQAFIQVNAYRADPNQERQGQYDIWGNVKKRRDTKPTIFFVESVDEITAKMNTRYSTYVCDAIGVSILHKRRS
jgi:hypothetical protein